MKEIASAGGVVYRKDPSGSVHLLAVEDRFGYMTLPKGMQEEGESLEQTALREIQEETGIRGVVEGELPTVSYTYSWGDELKRKQVFYFLVRAVGGELKAQEEEIAGVSWQTPEEFLAQQRFRGYANNLEVVEEALRRLGLCTG